MRCHEIHPDGGQVEIAAELVHELDADGKQLRVLSYTDYTAEEVRTLCVSPDEQAVPAPNGGRAQAPECGMVGGATCAFAQVAAQAGQPDADPFDLLEKYASDGELQFTLPDVLKLPPISHHGNVNEIIGKFGGADQLRSAVNQLQSLLYAT